MTTDEWLKDQCNIYANGECQTLACFRRGGFVSGAARVPKHIKPTCHAYEALQELEALRKEVEELKDENMKLRLEKI